MVEHDRDSGSPSDLIVRQRGPAERISGDVVLSTDLYLLLPRDVGQQDPFTPLF
jgi:hypothetical protein